jgi:hypothetical protein
MAQSRSLLLCRFLGHSHVSVNRLGEVVDSGSIDEDQEVLTCARCGATDQQVLKWVGYLPAALAGTLLTLVIVGPLLAATAVCGGFDRK